MLINKFLDKVCPINLGPLCSDFGMTLTSSWFKSHKNVCGPISLILCIISQRLPRLSRERSTDFTNELGVWLFRNDTELNKINILQRNMLEKRPLRG